MTSCPLEDTYLRRRYLLSTSRNPSLARYEPRSLDEMAVVSNMDTVLVCSRQWALGPRRSRVFTGIPLWAGGARILELLHSTINSRDQVYILTNHTLVHEPLTPTPWPRPPSSAPQTAHESPSSSPRTSPSQSQPTAYSP